MSSCHACMTKLTVDCTNPTTRSPTRSDIRGALPRISCTSSCWTSTRIFGRMRRRNRGMTEIWITTTMTSSPISAPWMVQSGPCKRSRPEDLWSSPKQAFHFQGGYCELPVFLLSSLRTTKKVAKSFIFRTQNRHNRWVFKCNRQMKVVAFTKTVIQCKIFLGLLCRQWIASQDREQ